MKKSLLVMVLLSVSALQSIKINLKPETSNYPLAVTCFQTKDDIDPIKHYFIRKDQKQTIIKRQDLIDELDNKDARQALNKAKTVFMEIKISSSDDITSPNITLYSDMIDLDANINIVTAPFGKYQAIGAVQITNKNLYEPDRDAYRYVEKLAHPGKLARKK